MLGSGGAVDLENSASDIASKVASEEEEGVSNVLRFADATERDGLDKRFNHLRREFCDHVGIGDAWRDSVNTDIEGGQFPGERFGKTIDGKLTGRVANTGRLTIDTNHRGSVEDGAATVLFH